MSKNISKKDSFYKNVSPNSTFTDNTRDNVYKDIIPSSSKRSDSRNNYYRNNQRKTFNHNYEEKNYDTHTSEDKHKRYESRGHRRIGSEDESENELKQRHSLSLSDNFYKDKIPPTSKRSDSRNNQHEASNYKFKGNIYEDNKYKRRESRQYRRNDRENKSENEQKQCHSKKNRKSTYIKAEIKTESVKRKRYHSEDKLEQDEPRKYRKLNYSNATGDTKPNSSKPTYPNTAKEDVKEETAEEETNPNTANAQLKKIDHKCKLCKESYKRQKDLSRHITNNHESGHKCNMCIKAFNLATELRHHEKTHHQRYLCQICCKHFKNRNLLRYHSLNHYE